MLNVPGNRTARTIALGAAAIMICVLAIGRTEFPGFGFEPPNAEARKSAVGALTGSSTMHQRSFDADASAFEPIPDPRRSDWLSQHNETGQTFSQYRRAFPNRPTAERSTLYLQPLGPFNTDAAPDLSLIQEFAEAFFDMPVRQLPPHALEGLPIKTRSRSFGKQILAEDVLEWLRPRVPEDAYCLLAVTMSDLYPDPKWNFVFGQATLRDRVGVYSFARYYSDDSPKSLESRRRLLMLRSCKVLAHETGHMFGIKHCVHFHCLMNGSNGLEETDAGPIHLCPVCLRKLHWAHPFDILERYEKLRMISLRMGWNNEAQWIEDRIATIEDDVDPDDQ